MVKTLQVISLLGLLLASGCDSSQDDSTLEKKPRPVEVQTLRISPPPSSSLVTASVASWKTEQIGFEVGGRIEWVAEPSTVIAGRVIDADGNLILDSKGKPISKGTPIAQIETERYQLQLDIATADVARAKQSVAALIIEIEQSLKSQIDAAKAELKLAQTEYDRSKSLEEQEAGSQADVDRDEAKLQTAESKMKQLAATEDAKQSELTSLRLQVKQAEQSEKDAKRNLDDCTLYSSFPGEIADTSVVPGSVVAAGNPVATLQMMDPIKIELEVSAEESRRLRKRQVIPVYVPEATGIKRREGFLYLIDSVADPQTRTFTVTLLMLNEKALDEALVDAEDNNIPVTEQPWRVDFSFLPGAKDGLLYVAADAIHEDAEGYYLWRINNFQKNELLPKDRMFDVSKLRIELGDARLPFLGNWIFQQIIINDETFDPNVNVVAGKLTLKNGDAESWEGNKILVDREQQWMARPGDFVKVDLSDGDVEPGYYVPMDTIVRESGKSFIFLVEPDEDSTSDTADIGKVKRVEILVSEESETTSSLRHVQPVGSSDSLAGKQFVSRGAHYLREGETVRIVRPGASE